MRSPRRILGHCSAAALGLALLPLSAAVAFAGQGGDAAQPPAQTAPAAPKPTPPQRAAYARWLEVQAAQVAARYRVVENATGVITTNHLQHNQAFRGRVRFDDAGRFSAVVGVQSGNSFTGSWNNTSLGTGDRQTAVSVKHLYGVGRPITGVEVQVGSLPFVRGESTEITTYDNDGYVTGERMTVSRPKQFFFDEVSVTAGYLGDARTPSVFSRLDRLGEWNYYQALVRRKLGRHVGLSGDVTSVAGIETLRQAVRLSTRGFSPLDWIRFEQYVRFDDSATAWGWAAHAEKSLGKRLGAGGGYADVDRHYGLLNADRFGAGRRVYGTGTVALRRDLQMGLFYQHGVRNPFVIPNKQRFDVVLTYNVAEALLPKR